MVVQHSWLMIDAVQLRSLLPNYNILKRREFEIIDDVAFSQFSSSFLNSCLFVGVLLPCLVVHSWFKRPFKKFSKKRGLCYSLSVIF